MFPLGMGWEKLGVGGSGRCRGTEPGQAAKLAVPRCALGRADLEASLVNAGEGERGKEEGKKKEKEKKKKRALSHMNKHEPGPERRGGRRVGSNAGHVSDARQSNARCHENIKF